MSGRLGIDDVVPEISGNYPAKAVVGEVFPVHATVWREGHDAISATLVVRGPRGTKPLRIPMDPGTEPDTVDAVFTPSAEGMWSFRIEAWSDPIATWKHAVEAKLAVGQGAAELANDLEIGARLFEQRARGTAGQQVQARGRHGVAAQRSGADGSRRAGLRLRRRRTAPRHSAP